MATRLCCEMLEKKAWMPLCVLVGLLRQLFSFLDDMVKYGDDEVQEAATARGVLLTLEQWAQLSELDRFALCKLARPGHDHHNLEAAFSEVLV